ncbi:hypothetical protein QCA50_011854 [Cerrena zonata]|uniref:Metallo-beta-lactamase domain-containing protein n=1 Tax=Cerrena zonata TaxID=2478898 RepID=A0AAW0FZZ7_9APHY
MTTIILSSARQATFDKSLTDVPFPSDTSKTGILESINALGAKLFWVGNATCILEYQSIRFMTDPNFLHQGDHVHLGPGVVGTRVREPAFDYTQCPAVDFILLSHLHGDHFDDLVAERLRRNIPIISTPHACENLEPQGFTSLYPLQTWEKITIQKGEDTITITSMPGKHTLGVIESADSVLHAIPPVMGSLIEFKREDGSLYNLYISGDTLYYDELKEIHVRHPHIHLALIHLGGTTLPVIQVMVTMNASQGIKLLCALQPDKAIPIHMDDYDVFLSGVKEFQDAVEKEGWKDRVVFIERGQHFSF